MSEDIRWIQRFAQYKKAFANLKNAIDLNNQRELTKLEEQGLIKSFELVHELSHMNIQIISKRNCLCKRLLKLFFIYGQQ